MNPSALLTLTLLLTPFAHAADCDITQQPAATLLLPYFIVDFVAGSPTAPRAVTTQYTIINEEISPI